QPVIPFVGSVLFIAPCPTQVVPPCSYGNVVTFPPSCQECGHTMPPSRSPSRLPVTSPPSCACPTVRAGGLPAASSAGQTLARLVRRGVVPGVRGGTGGGMRVKSGFVFPILCHALEPARQALCT